MTGVRLLFGITLVIGAMCAAIMASVTPVDEAVLEWIRWTARSSLVLFMLTYVARPAQQLWRTPLTKRLLAERKWIGDGFAVSHLFHLGGIVMLAVLDWDAFAAGRSIATVVASLMFVILFAMAITSIDRVRKAMSKRAWNGLHRTGIHLAWVIFAVTYVGHMKVSPVWVIAVFPLAAIAVIRFAAWLRALRRNAARVASAF